MRESLHRIWGLVVKEFLQLFRDKVLIAFVIVGPLIELLLMGGLAGGGVKNLPMAVVDMDRSRASRELALRLDQTEELRTVAYLDSVEAAQGLMRRGEVAVIVVVPPDYGRRLASLGGGAEVQIIADGSNYLISTVALSTGESVAAEIARDLVARQMMGSSASLELRFVARFNAALDDRPGAITSILGLIVYQVTLVVAARSFTRERELGTLEQLRVTPLGRLEMIIGKAAPTLAVGMLDGLLMIGLSILWFDLPVRGSLPLLFLLTVPFVLTQVGWGTFISLISRTQQQAILFVFALAMLEVGSSGFMVPTSALPGVMRVISNGSAVRHYLAILRGVMLRGAGFDSLWLPSLALVLIAIATSLLAWLRLLVGLDAASPRQLLRRLGRRRARRKARAARRRRRRQPGWGRELV